MEDTGVNKKRISIVMCTYNGEAFIREQMDSILAQTLPADEIIVQDDGSSDGTMEILGEYAERHPQMKIYKNEGEHGVNGNFFSALRRATGDFIAIADQDDIWETRKTELQMKAIGDKMMCAGRSVPFCSNDRQVSLNYDARVPNCNLVRLLYASIPGHVMFFRRELLACIPDIREIQTKSYYDVILATTAAALDSIILLNERVVNHRRYVGAATYSNVDKLRSRSSANMLRMVWWGIRHFKEVKPFMAKHFGVRFRFLSSIKSDAAIYQDAVKILKYESSTGIGDLLRLTRYYIKYRHVLFYTYESDPVAFIRALLHPFMQVYVYRYLCSR